jgi:hypothetical protein
MEPNLENPEYYSVSERLQIRCYDLLDRSEKQQMESFQLNRERLQLQKDVRVLQIEKKEAEEKLQSMETERNQLRAEKDQLQGCTRCVICLTNDRDTMFEPCSHFSFCKSCATRYLAYERATGRVPSCPVCRGSIAAIRNAYVT